MAVLKPLRVVIDNYPEGSSGRDGGGEQSRGSKAPGRARCRFREVLYIEQDDFREDPPKQYFRLSPGTRSAAALRLFHYLHRRGER